MDTQLIKTYLSAGLWIIPLRDKIPLSICKGWQLKPLPEATVLSSFPRLANNIGCVCGKQTGIICIDIDPKRGGMTWYNANKDRLDGCITETTGSGGLHLLYRYPKEKDVPSSRDAIADGVEVLSDGRYFVTAPSIHPETKELYTIERGLDLTHVINEAEIIPAWLLADIKKCSGTTLPVAKSAGLTKPDYSEYNLSFARAELQSVHAIEGQCGDENTFKACVLGRDYSIPKEMWLKEIIKWNQTHCTPSWHLEELKTKINNAYSYAKLEAGTKNAQSDFGDVKVDGVESIATAEEASITIDRNKKNLKEINVETNYEYKKPNECASKILSVVFKNTLRYSNEDFYLYESDCWRLIKMEELSSKVRNILRSESSVNVKSNDIAEIIKAIRDQLLKGRVLPLDTRIDGKRGDFIRVNNGVLNLQNMELSSHDLNWFSLTKLPYDYTPDAACPTWHSFLTSIFGEDDRTKEALRGWMAYCLSNSHRFQKAMLFLGGTRAGKGIITRVIEKLIGVENTTGTSLTRLAGSFGLHPLVGKKVCFLHDAHKGHGSMADIALEQLKSIIGHDSMQINRKGKDILDTRLTCKVMFIANAMPQFIDARSAFLARLIIIPFKESFAGREDWGLEDKLSFELTGIFNWVCEGLHYIQDGKRLPESGWQESLIKDLARSMDPLTAFIADEVEFVADGKISREDLLSRYKSWCEEHGRQPKNLDRFIAEFNQAMPSSVEYTREQDCFNRLKIFKGIRLKNVLTEFDL